MKYFKPKIHICYLTILTLFIAIAPNSLTLHAHDPKDAILGINRDNIGYLRYIHFENQFDNASVKYTFGEVRIFNNNSKMFIPLLNRANEEYTLDGIDIQGVDSMLLSKAKTNRFKYAPNSHIRFFRKLEVSVVNGHKPPFDPSIEGQNGEGSSIQDYKWVVGKNQISDQTEFLIELVKVDDPSAIYVIDSAGVDANNDQVVAHHYGYNSELLNHVRKLPIEFANQDVYIRIKPIRLGRPGKYLTLKIVPHWISQSVLPEHEIHLKPQARNEKFMDKIINKYFNEALLYCDSVKTVTGHLPDRLPILDALNLEQKQIFEKMFFDVKILNNDSIFNEKNNDQIKPADIYIGEDIQKKLSVTSINCIPFDKTISLNIHCMIGLPEATITLFDYQYALLKDIWHGDLHPGINKVSLDNLDLTRGVYLLQIGTNPQKATISAIIKR